MPRSRRRQLPRVAVTSDQSLVAESIRAALRGRGFDPVTLYWPGQRRAAGEPGRPRWLGLGLMVSELDTPEQIRSARILLATWTGRWLVMTNAPVGPVWGGALEAGATRVVPASWTLDEVVAGLVSLPDAPDPAHEATRTALVDAWHQQRSDRTERAGRLQSLTPRERQVLEMLYGGVGVGEIAGLLGISPATVRSQVKAILRKLDVSSQLGAVSALEQHAAEDGGS